MRHNRIREFRKAKGLTLDELSEKTGISQGHLSRLEGNKRMLLPPVAEKLAEELGVRAAEILGLDTDDPATPAVVQAGFSDDCSRYQPTNLNDPLARLETDHEYLYKVETDVLARAGISGRRDATSRTTTLGGASFTITTGFSITRGGGGGACLTTTTGGGAGDGATTATG